MLFMSPQWRHKNPLPQPYLRHNPQCPRHRLWRRHLHLVHLQTLTAKTRRPATRRTKMRWMWMGSSPLRKLLHRKGMKHKSVLGVSTSKYINWSAEWAVSRIDEVDIAGGWTAKDPCVHLSHMSRVSKNRLPQRSLCCTGKSVLLDWINHEANRKN